MTLEDRVREERQLNAFYDEWIKIAFLLVYTFRFFSTWTTRAIHFNPREIENDGILLHFKIIEIKLHLVLSS